MNVKYPVVALIAAAAAVGAATISAVPAQADTEADVFFGAVNQYRLGDIDPATAVRVGEAVCPMLAEPGQNTADVAARVAEELGRPIGAATMFTTLAIQSFCPRAVEALTDGRPFSFFD